MNIGDRLHLLRKAESLTLEEVSKELGITRQTLQKYEKGVISNIPSDKIEKMAKIYHSSPAYIMGWEEESPIERFEKETDPDVLFAAHHDGEWTEDEIRQIKEYMEFVKARRPKK